MKILHPLTALLIMCSITACNCTGKTKTEKKMEKKTESKAFTFYNIVPMSIGKEEETAADMIEYYKRTGNDIVLYSMTLHPEGFPARKKADIMINSYRKFKAALAGSGVRPGVLLQSILGHWPRVDRKEEAWMRAVDINGKAERFCPLDPEFQKYIAYFTTELAKENPSFILGDDDVRAFSPAAECFCARHVKLFNQRTGMNLSADEMRQAVKDSKPGDKVFETFMQLQREMVNGVGELVRKSIDSVNPAIPGGACMPGWERRFCNQTAKAFAGKNHPAVMRVCNANYMETGAKIFPVVLVRSLALRAAHPDIPVVLDEADTFPHSLYSRSATSWHAKLCTSIMAGMKGAKTWYVNARISGKLTSRNYIDTLAENRNFYQQLAREAENSELSGLIQPGSRNFPNWHFTDPSEKFVEERNWAEIMCAAYGIPFYCSFELDKPGIYLLAGEKAVSRFTDAELKKMLSGKVLVDGQAALAITRRGLEEYLGVKAEAKKFRFNREYYRKGESLYFSYSQSVPFLTVTAPDAEVVTWYGYAASSGETEPENVAPATVVAKNSLGGTVCTTGFNMDVSENYYHNIGRKTWLLNVLEKINGSPIDICVENDQNFFALTRKTPVGEIIMTVGNLNFDPVKNLSLHCAVEPEEILRLTPEGKWKKVPFRFENGIAVTGIPVACYELIALKIRWMR